MRNYLHRLLERATGEPSAASQGALVPHAVPRREGGDDDPLDVSTLSEAAPPAAPPSRFSEAPHVASLSWGEMRSPSLTVPTQPLVSPTQVASSTEVRAPERTEREARVPHQPLQPGPPRLERVQKRHEAIDPIDAAFDTPRSESVRLEAAPPTPRASTRSEGVPAEYPRGLDAPAPLPPSVDVEPRSLPPLRLEPPKVLTPEANLRASAPFALAPPAVAERAPLPPPVPALSIGRLIVEVMPTPHAPPAPAPIAVQRKAPVAVAAQSTILRRGFGLGQS